MNRRLALVAAPLVVLISATPALASWNGTSTSANGYTESATLGSPQAASAGSATATQLTITVTNGPTSSSAPTSGYRVDRVSPAKTGACYIAGTTGGCSDTGLTPATAYQYKVFSVIGSNLTNSSTRKVTWISSASLTTVSVSTAAASGYMHIAGFSTSTQNSTNSWAPKATITVQDAAGNPVQGVAVTGAWSPTSTTGNSCTTTSTGTCALNVNNNTYSRSTVTSATWTANSSTGLAKSGVIWDKSADTAESATVNAP